jgi:phage terminase large subunit
MLPEAAQARKAIWEAVNPHSGKRRIDEAFPLRSESMNARNVDPLQERIDVAGGGIGQLQQPGRLAPGRRRVLGVGAGESGGRAYLRPILLENGGWQMFITTPRGKNHATRPMRQG